MKLIEVLGRVIWTLVFAPAALPGLAATGGRAGFAF